MSSHTKPRDVVAYSPRITPEELRISEEARQVWKDVTKAFLPTIRKIPALKWIIYRLRRADHRSDPLELLANAIVGLFNADLPEASLRRFELFIGQLIDNLCVGKATRDLDQLDRLEFSAEHQENGFEHERHLARGNVSAELLEAEASAIEAEIAVSKEKARQLRRRARLMVYSGAVVA